jgi:hypothetical protein
MKSSALTDQQWERLGPLLPPQTPHTGRPAKDHRTVPQWHPLDLADGLPGARSAGALWLVEDRLQPLLPLATGWALGPRTRRAATQRGHGRPAGLVPALRGQHRRSGAPACGRGKRGDPTAEALGRSRGGYGTKIHLRAERGGKPMVPILTGGERHEQPVLPLLMERGAIKRVGRGRPRVRPDAVAGDKGYSSPTVQ